MFNKNLFWFAPVLLTLTLVEAVFILNGQFITLANMFHLLTMGTLVVGIHKLGSK